MLEARLAELGANALAGIATAKSPEDLELVRVEVLGRKGTLAQISKEMGKVAPDQRAAEPQAKKMGLKLPRDK
jgi:phenylalanyl-tRNA synthetase alpha chain